MLSNQYWPELWQLAQANWDDVHQLELIHEQLVLRRKARPRKRAAEIISRISQLRDDRIFVCEATDKASKEHVMVLGDYHPWRKEKLKDEASRDEYSKAVLQVKKGDEDQEIEFGIDIDDIVTERLSVAVVPSSDPQNIDTGIRRIAQAVAAAHWRVDATSALVRHQAIKSAKSGGERSIDVHVSSVHIPHNENTQAILRDKLVLLLDDVTTSESSLRACKRLLEEAGAKRVAMLALAKTV